MNWMMATRVALRALATNKLRTTLTMLGIIIGVGAVIALMSVGKGSEAQITNQIQGLGTNLLFVRPGSTSTQGVRTATGSAASLTLDDATALEQIPGVSAVAPEASGGRGQLVANGANWNTSIIGVTEGYAAVRNTKIASGDWISTQQVDSKSTVVVLGDTVATSLFPGSDPIGQTIRVSVGNSSGVNLRVIGVAEKKGGTGFGSTDDQIYVPITTAQTRFSVQRNATGAKSVSTINVQIANEKQSAQVTTEIGDLLRTRHKVVEDDFTIQSQADVLGTLSQISGTFTLLLGAIAGISLFVGGIGVMNIMLVAVSERTREIGIRKAVGARKKDIMLQFLWEALIVSILGGGIGVAAGMGVSSALNAGIVGQTISTVVTADSVILAFSVSAAVGLCFGIYPANRAAGLSPIQALRTD